MFRQHVYRSSLVAALALLTAAAVVPSSDLGAQRPRFFSDDPLPRDPETQDASKVEEWDIGLTPDLLHNLFGKPGDRASNVRAQNVNTADEVPDSSWFTNRIYAKPLSTDDVTRGPLTTDGPAPGKWTVIRGKGAGVAPGFTARDEKGVMWFVSFDGRDNPVAPTAAIAVATRLFWALGYFQVENHLTTLRPENVVVDPSATLRAHGKRRRMTAKDLEQVFDRAAKSADGLYRVIAGRRPSRPPGWRVQVLRDQAGRSERRRPARAPPRAARAAGVRRVGQPRGHESRQHARHRHHRKRPRRRPPLPAGCGFDVRHRRALSSRRRRRVPVPVRGRHAVEAAADVRVLPEPVADASITTNTPRLAGSKGTSSSPRTGSRACPWLRFGMSVRTTRSGRRCG